MIGELTKSVQSLMEAKSKPESEVTKEFDPNQPRWLDGRWIDAATIMDAARSVNEAAKLFAMVDSTERHRLAVKLVESGMSYQDAIKASMTSPVTEPVASVDPMLEWKQRGYRSERFKGWFGDWENDPANASKVVDETGIPSENSPITRDYVDQLGAPLVMYHGVRTSNGDFDSFDTEKVSSGYLAYGPGSILRTIGVSLRTTPR